MENKDSKYDTDIINQWLKHHERNDIDFKKLNEDIEKKGQDRMKELIETGKTTWTIPESVNYMQVVPDSQYIEDLTQILMQLAYLKNRADKKEYNEGLKGYEMRITTIQEDIDHLLVAVQNSINQGYKMVKE